jgi:hypothetical protein
MKQDMDLNNEVRHSTTTSDSDPAYVRPDWVDVMMRNAEAAAAAANNGQSSSYSDKVIGNQAFGDQAGTDDNSNTSNSDLIANLAPQTQQQLDDERLRKAILRYLVTNSNGAYHYSATLKDIIRDIVKAHVSTAEQFTATAQSVLEVLHNDPQKRFLISGEGDGIIVKRCFVRGDEEEISDLVEEWRLLIAKFLLDCKRSVGLSDIGSRYISEVVSYESDIHFFTLPILTNLLPSYLSECNIQCC